MAVKQRTAALRWLLGGAVLPLLGAVACGGTSYGDVPRLEGPSPVAQLRMLGTVWTVAQERPGGEARRHAMSVAQAPDRPPRGTPAQVPMRPDELVVGVEIGGEVIAYPLRFLNQVEVLNDEAGGTPVAVTWCPLAGTATIFDRRVAGTVHTFHFGTSLIHDSLLLVDQETGSVWAQIAREAISGSHEGTGLEVIPSLQTTWAFWSARHPDTQVMGFPQEQGYPYVYADFPADHFPNPLPSHHDPAPLGLGVEVAGEHWFFPLRELDELHGDLPRLADGALQVRYEPAGLVAWVEDRNGDLIDSQMAYERAWLAVHPESHVYSYTFPGLHP